MNTLISSIFRTLHIDNVDKNFVFSPASYLEAVHNLCLCLKGNNLKEVLDALQIKELDLLDYIQTYKQNLDLETYNALFYAQEYQLALNPAVIYQIQELGSNIESLDFNNTLSIVNKINSIVTEKTHGKINDLISSQDLSDLTKFIILNCVYFKRDWLYPMKYKKVYEPFYGNKQQIQIKYLTDQTRYNYYSDNILDIIELPYKDSNICCYLLIPQNNLFNIINNLEENYKKIQLVANDCPVSITCPAFKTESTFNLIPPTQTAGINKIFEWNKDWSLINFDKLLPEAVLSVNLIRQKAYIDFTQKGTEATAATTMFMCASGCASPGTLMPKIKYIRADKPFLYVLANKNNKNIPLFMGIINELEGN